MDEIRVTHQTIAASHETSLQRAWSEIQRDLGHESADTLPSRVRRRFDRLAGLIELADQEYADIREQLARYDARLPRDTGHGSAEHRLDKLTVRAFIRDSRRLRRTDRVIAARVGSQLGRAWVTDDDVARLQDLNLNSMVALDTALAARERTVVSVAAAWMHVVHQPLQSWEDSYLPRGITLLYLWYVMLAETGDRATIARAIAKTEEVDSQSADAWAAQLLDAYRAATAGRSLDTE